MLNSNQAANRNVSTLSALWFDVPKNRLLTDNTVHLGPGEASLSGCQPLLGYLSHWSFTFLQYSIHISFRAFIHMFVLQLAHDHNLTPWNQIPSLALANLCSSDLIPGVANGTEFWVYWTLLLEALAALLQWCMCNYVRWIISFGRILPCGWPRYKPPRRGCPFLYCLFSHLHIVLSDSPCFRTFCWAGAPVHGMFASP